MAIFGFFSILSVLFILETMARASLEPVRTIQLGASSTNYKSIDMSSSRSDHHSKFSQSGLIRNNDSTDSGFRDSTHFEISTGADDSINDRKFELPELCSLFLGNTAQKIYTAFIIVYMYGTLWAYSTVFSNAFAAHVPIGQYSYHMYLILFGCIVIPMSLMEFSEQVMVQVTLTVFRIVMLLIMICTVIAANDSQQPEFGALSKTSFENSEPAFNIDKL
jgi:hypothetical protein